jgi:hypothetical protein
VPASINTIIRGGHPPLFLVTTVIGASSVLSRLIARQATEMAGGGITGASTINFKVTPAEGEAMGTQSRLASAASKLTHVFCYLQPQAKEIAPSQW